MIYDNYSHCKLFPFSLARDPRTWLRQLPTGSLTCWNEIRSDFINNLFDEVKYWEGRNKISTFCQGDHEAFKDAWKRFWEYQLDYPHHGYSEPQLINTLFRGLNLDIQIYLDVFSNGNFSTRSLKKARRLIENATESKAFKRWNVEKKQTINSTDKRHLAEIKASL